MSEESKRLQPGDLAFLSERSHIYVDATSIGTESILSYTKNERVAVIIIQTSISAKPFLGLQAMVVTSAGVGYIFEESLCLV